MRRSDGTSAGPRRGARAGRLVASVAAVLVGCAALAGLGVGAVHGARGTVALSTNHQVAEWEIDAAYWSCLDTQARSLVTTGERVWLDTASYVTYIALEKLLGSWVDLVGTRRHAQVYLTLHPRHGPGACLGSVVVGRFPGPRGPGTVVRVGSGASLPGNVLQLPATPL